MKKHRKLTRLSKAELHNIKNRLEGRSYKGEKGKFQPAQIAQINSKYYQHVCAALNVKNKILAVFKDNERKVITSCAVII